MAASEAGGTNQQIFNMLSNVMSSELQLWVSSAINSQENNLMRLIAAYEPPLSLLGCIPSCGSIPPPPPSKCVLVLNASLFHGHLIGCRRREVTHIFHLLPRAGVKSMAGRCGLAGHLAEGDRLRPARGPEQAVPECQNSEPGGVGPLPRILGGGRCPAEPA